MNYSVCPDHSDRKQELVCLTDDCDHRYEVRCVQCLMTSKCKQNHHWKMMTEIIEEMHQVCEIAQSQAEKRSSNSQSNSNSANESHKKHIQQIIGDMETRAQAIQQSIIDKIQIRAINLVSKTGSGESYLTVKKILKGCKKDTAPGIVSSNIKKIGDFFKCNEGTLELLESAPQEIGDVDISMFENQCNKVLDNIEYIIADDGEIPSQEKTAEKNYQKQIDKLLDQLKQLPVLQNRIQALSEKLQIKDAKLKKLEGGSQSPTKEELDLSMKKKSSIEEMEQLRVRNIGRIQGLLQRRKQLFNAFQQYVKKNPQEELYVYNLKSGVNAIKLQIPTLSNVTYLFNENSLSVCDELQFLGYSDATQGDQNIEIPLISTRKQKPKMKQHDIDINPLLELLMGLR